MERFDYAVFQGDRYVNNAMLTREEAAELEAKGMRCIDTDATTDDNLPRFRGRRSVTTKGRYRGWWD